MFTLDMIICRKKVIVKIIKSKLNPKKKSKALNVTATGIIRGPKKIYESMAIFYKKRKLFFLRNFSNYIIYQIQNRKKQVDKEKFT